jgi:ring-1,2-phenylacetyl-CoA epoxidase subunit PaaE
VKSADLAFICGPSPMMTAVSETLQAHGMAKNAIKMELFSSAQPGRAASRAAPSKALDMEQSIATIIIDGVAREIEIAQDGQSVLEAALHEKIDAPYACRAGVCSTCRAKLLEGEVEMDQNYALDDDDVARGYILTCQSHPRSKRIVVDYDQ